MTLTEFLECIKDEHIDEIIEIEDPDELDDLETDRYLTELERRNNG